MNVGSYKALILDDEYLLGEILTRALKSEGIDSIAVTSVDTAIERLLEHSFDIVISDVYLPDKNGADLFNYAQENNPGLPFIFITGNPDFENAVDFLKQGAYDYVSKPFELRTLTNKVREVIGASRRRNQEKNLVKDLRQMLNQRFQELKIYQDIFQSEKDGLLILDVEGVIARVNPGFEKMSGYRETDVMNQPVAMLSRSVLPGISFPSIRAEIEKTGYWKQELRATRNNGDYWIANISFFAVKNEENDTFAYCAIINDVTSLRDVERALIDSLKSANLAQEAIIFGLAKLAEYRDPETGFHLERIRSYSKELALAMLHHPKYEDRISEKDIDMLYRSAPLHDIGKVGIPDHVLLKPGRLTDEEFEVMQTHTTIGYQTLLSIREQFGSTDFLDMGIQITRSHHEKYNGKGYPQGLKGDDIPLAAQIVAIADVYDALTSKRIYKKAFSHEVSLNTMKIERGKHFDPELFDLFLEIARQFNTIREEVQRNEELDGEGG